VRRAELVPLQRLWTTQWSNHWALHR